jgi:glycosyltransferase involved in cell wall biosynthesis
LVRRLAAARLDVLLQDELCHPSFFWSNQRLREQIKYPLVSIVHHLRSSERFPAWQTRLYRMIERSYFRSLDGMILNSLTTGREVNQLLVEKMPSAQLVALPGGNHLGIQISTDEITKRCEQPGPLRLLFIGNVIPRKGLLELLQALARLAPDSWSLKVIGNLQVDRRYVRRIREEITRLRMNAGVELCGAVTREVLLESLRTSQVLVVCSFYEGYGIVYLEGMGFGLPVIASTAGGASEIITHGKDGLLVQPGKINELEESLRIMAGDRAGLLGMSLAARKRYLAQPTWEQMGKKIREYLQHLVS